MLHSKSCQTYQADIIYLASLNSGREKIKVNSQCKNDRIEGPISVSTQLWRWKINERDITSGDENRNNIIL
jgi:hypothetical protein